MVVVSPLLVSSDLQFYSYCPPLHLQILASGSLFCVIAMLLKITVGFPAVGYYDCFLFNPPFNRRQQSCFVSFVHCHHAEDIFHSVSFSIPPNTHCPTTWCPRRYFRFPNLLSSIWTMVASPPMFRLLSNIVISQTSRQKSVPVYVCTTCYPSSRVIWLCLLNILTPLVRELEYFLQYRVTLRELASPSYWCLCPVSFAVCLYSAVPFQAIWSVVACQYFHFYVPVRTELWLSKWAFRHWSATQ